MEASCFFVKIINLLGSIDNFPQPLLNLHETAWDSQVRQDQDLYPTSPLPLSACTLMASILMSTRAVSLLWSITLSPLMARGYNTLSNGDVDALLESAGIDGLMDY